MEYSTHWVFTADASKALRMPSSTLRSLKNHLELEPGVHWLYSTGKKNSPILWNVPAIREWQIEKTVLEIRSTDAKRQEEARENASAIASFDEPDSLTPTEAEEGGR